MRDYKVANVLLPDKMSNQNQQNVFPVSALLGGAAIWGLLWYPYRLLEQAEYSGPVATTITYAFACCWVWWYSGKIWQSPAS